MFEEKGLMDELRPLTIEFCYFEEVPVFSYLIFLYAGEFLDILAVFSLFGGLTLRDIWLFSFGALTGDEYTS